MWVPGATLTAPALFLAGVAASPHCTLMCGALAAHHARAAQPAHLPQSLLLVHGGRVLAYAALGALAGDIGQGILRQLPAPVLGRALQGLAAVGLMLVGAQMALARPSARGCCTTPPPVVRQWPAALRALVRGLSWAAVPCGLLYSVLALAALSASAVSGALLTAAFALGGSPMLALIGWGGRQGSLPPLRRRATGWGLVGLGAASLAAVLLWHVGTPLWCRVPA